MENTSIKVRYAASRSRFEAYFYTVEASGRAYGGNVFYVGSDVHQVIARAQSEGVVRKMAVWW